MDTTTEGGRTSREALPVCPNCGQYQRPRQTTTGHTVYDCFHDCAARGFLEAPAASGAPEPGDELLPCGHLEREHQGDVCEDADPCPCCGGPSTLLGALGKVIHYRCRDCGADYSREV